MQQGLTISVVDPDSDYLGIEINVASDRFAGRTRIFAGLNELTEFARHIEGFPATPGDHREYQFGIRKPGKAGGHCAVRLQCTDRAGHARLEVTIDDDSQLHEPATAAFGFPVFAADLDRFTDQLRDVENAKRGSAHLPQAV